MPNELSNGKPWGKTNQGGKSDTGFTNALRNAMKPNTRKKNSINLSRPTEPQRTLSSSPQRTLSSSPQRTLSSSPQRTLSSSPQRTLSSSPMPKSLKQSKR